MIEESVTIVLPIPPACLSPNKPCGSRGGRIARAAAQKKQRRLAREQTALQDVSETWERVVVQATFFHATDRRRDGANFNAMLKGAFDGIVDAGLVLDDDHKHWSTMPPKFEQDKKAPRVEITITRSPDIDPIQPDGA